MITVPRLSYDRYRAEIVTQAELLAGQLKDADLTRRVPSCPDWNAGQLVRHLGGAHRWAETVVRTRPADLGPESEVGPGDVTRYANEEPEVVTPWLVAGATALADTLRTAGPGAPVPTPVPSGTTDFYARRMCHETAVHRADAMLALGAEYTLDPDVALDAMDEWMELGSLPQNLEWHPVTRELLGPGRTLHFHATDAEQAEWLVDLTGDTLAWRPAHEKAAVAVRAPLTQLLLLVYNRRTPDGLEIFGDRELLDFWLERVGFS